MQLKILFLLPEARAGRWASEGTTKLTMTFYSLAASLLFIVLCEPSGCSGLIPYANTPSGFSSSSTSKSNGQGTSLHAVKIEGYEQAFRTIDECAVSGTATDDLYDAVRFIDKNALRIYPDLDHKQQLWDEAHGSWKLQMATGGGKFTTFKPVPIFAYAMIDENNFGNGVGANEKWILLSLLGPHLFHTKRRQMVITVKDMYLFGSYCVSNKLPNFIRDGIGLGKHPDDWQKDGQRAPAFTFIGASEKALVARGGSGGIAIWSRLDNDIRPTAYGDVPSE